MFECPSTGEPVYTRLRFGRWLDDQPDSEFATACFKCSELHRFRRSDAILVMDDGRVPA